MNLSELNSWHINLSNEYGSIGEKVAKRWLQERGYEVYSFIEIMWMFYSKQKIKKKFIDTFFGERLDNVYA